MALSGLELSQPSGHLRHVAIVHCHRTLTYKEFHRQISDITKRLWAMGIRAGD